MIARIFTIPCRDLIYLVSMKSGAYFSVDEVLETTLIIALGKTTPIVNWVLDETMFTSIDCNLVETFTELDGTKIFLGELGREAITCATIFSGSKSWIS